MASAIYRPTLAVTPQRRTPATVPLAVSSAVNAANVVKEANVANAVNAATTTVVAADATETAEIAEEAEIEAEVAEAVEAVGNEIFTRQLLILKKTLPLRSIFKKI